jgi:hypothetical protein
MDNVQKHNTCGNFKALSPSSEATNFSVIQELPNILWNLEVHYCPCKSLPLVSIRSQTNSIYTTYSISLRSVLILYFHLRLDLPNNLFPLTFLPKAYMRSSFPHACYMPCFSHIHWLDHSNFTWRKRGSYEALHWAIITSLLFLNPSSVQIFSSAPCSQSPSVCVLPLMSETKFHAHTKHTLIKVNTAAKIPAPR